MDLLTILVWTHVVRTHSSKSVASEHVLGMGAPHRSCICLTTKVQCTKVALRMVECVTCNMRSTAGVTGAGMTAMLSAAPVGGCEVLAPSSHWPAPPTVHASLYAPRLSTKPAEQLAQQLPVQLSLQHLADSSSVHCPAERSDPW